MRWASLILIIFAALLPAASAQEGLTIASGSAVRLELPQAHFLIFQGTDGEVLKISIKGEIFYKGRLLTTDEEILWGLRVALSPGDWCERWEKSRTGKLP